MTFKMRKVGVAYLFDGDTRVTLDEVTTGRDAVVDAGPIQLQADEIADGEFLHWET